MVFVLVGGKYCQGLGDRLRRERGRIGPVGRPGRVKHKPGVDIDHFLPDAHDEARAAQAPYSELFPRF